MTYHIASFYTRGLPEPEQPKRKIIKVETLAEYAARQSITECTLNTDDHYRLWVTYTDWRGNKTRKPSSGSWQAIEQKDRIVSGNTHKRIVLAYPHPHSRTEFAMDDVCSDSEYWTWVAERKNEQALGVAA